MGHRQSFWVPLRRHAWPVVDCLLAPWGGYATGTTRPESYVGTVQVDTDRFERLLHYELDFIRNPIAAFKQRTSGAPSGGSWVWRESLFAHRQLHVVLFPVDDGTAVYAHWEYSWLRHPIRHYRIEELDASGGVETLRERLDDHESEAFPDGIPYRVESPEIERDRPTDEEPEETTADSSAEESDDSPTPELDA